MSTGAELADKKAKALLATMEGINGSSVLSPKDAEINAIENILLAEAKDHADWELLGKIVRSDRRLKAQRRFAAGGERSRSSGRRSI